MPRDWKETFDRISVCWKGHGGAAFERMSQLSQAIALPNVPKLEVQDALTILKESKDQWQEFSGGVNAIVNGEKLKWAKIQELAEIADNLSEEGSGDEDQATAVLTAMNDALKESGNPQNVRQRLAQHALEEIFEVGVYRTYDYTAQDDMDDVAERSTQDPIWSELGELKATLNDKLWNKRTLQKWHKIYLKWRRIILDGNNSVDTDLVDPFEKLWKAANGEGVTKKSAIEILGLGEEVYTGLESGGAFDLNITDDEDEEDDEDENEESDQDSV